MDRRKVLERIVQGFSVTALAAFTYPFIKSFLPSFSNEMTMEVDISDLQPGQSRLVHWLGRNLVLVRRPPEVIAALKAPRDELKDPDSSHSNQPDFAANPFRSRRPELFVAFTNCTHLGCEVLKKEDAFTCPCHQSEFDAAGRVIEGAAAPTNLEIPNYQFLSRNVIQLKPMENS